MSRPKTHFHPLYAQVLKESRVLQKLPVRQHRENDSNFKGIEFPKKDKQFMEAFSRTSRHLLIHTCGRLGRQNSLNAPEEVIESEFELLGKRLSELAGIIRITLNSVSPTAYMSFFAREHFNIRGYLELAPAFARGRRLKFEEFPEEKLETGRKIRSFASEKSNESLRELLMLLKEIELGILKEAAEPYGGLDESEWSAVFDTVQAVGSAISGGRERVLGMLAQICPKEFREVMRLRGQYVADSGESEDGLVPPIELLEDYLIPFGLYIRAEGSSSSLIPVNKMCQFGGQLTCLVVSDPSMLTERGVLGEARGSIMLLSSEEPPLVQHELQHLLDNACMLGGGELAGEYRAFLASLAFLGPDEWEMAAYTTDQLMQRVLGKNGYKSGTHRQAAQRILSELVVYALVLTGSNSRESRRRHCISLCAEAHTLLNQGYKEEFGLTYDQLLEPFRPE